MQQEDDPYQFLKMKLASLLLFLLFTLLSQAQFSKGIQEAEGAWIRRDVKKRMIYLCFTAHEYMEGLPFILETLQKENIKASFFLTGDFVRKHPELTKKIYRSGHYVGAHSDKHLLYCDWKNRDSMLVSMADIKEDIQNNINALASLEISKSKTKVFMPPFEWYNRAIANQIRTWGYELVNFTPGTSSNADYTTPEMKNYLSSDTIVSRILRYEEKDPNGLNGFHLLIHVGTDEKRTDKLYHKIPLLLSILNNKGYAWGRF